VHIIEARELKAENLDGTSDPVVYVECFGQKQNTICIKQVRTVVMCLLCVLYRWRGRPRRFRRASLLVSALECAWTVLRAVPCMVGSIFCPSCVWW
jgi:ribosomal protein S27E